jgi:outer membrane lipoprotein-sorting protein
MALVGLSSVSCAAPLMKLPVGPGMPAPDAADALAQAAAACRRVKTLTAEIATTGSAGGRRVRGRLLAGVAAPASVRLEATAPFGPPVFIFVATGNDATLLLPRDERVLEHGRPDAVLDAVAGVPLDAAELYATLTGCAPAGSPSSGRTLGADWRVVHLSAGPNNYELYVRRDRGAQAWRLVATTRQGPTDGVVRVEYRDFQNGLPRAMHIRGDGFQGTTFDLTLALAQVETNVPLGDDVFRLEIPPSAVPITVDELRRARLGLREN